MSEQPKILVLPQPDLYDEIMTKETDERLQNLGEITRNMESRNWSSSELASKIGSYDVIVTGWGTPIFSDEVLAAADRLRLVGHTAGSIKRMLPPRSLTAAST